MTQHRHRTKVGLGIGDDAGLQAAVRIHANFAEYVPFALLLMALLETSVPSWGVHALGVALVVARVWPGEVRAQLSSLSCCARKAAC